MNLNEKVENRTKEFKANLQQKPKEEKKLFHYYSVLNLSNRIVHYEDLKAIKLKENLIEFFNELESLNFELNDKYFSSKLHNKYLLPISLYLFKKEKFLASSDLRFLIIIGVLLDATLVYFISNYYYPISTPTLLCLGLYRRKEAKKSGKYSKMFW